MQYICESCGAEAGTRLRICPNIGCLERNTFRAEVRGELPRRSRPELISCAELAAAPLPVPRPVPKPWKRILPLWGGEAIGVLLRGLRGRGKTSVALRGAHDLYRSCLFVSGEEKARATMKRRIHRLKLDSASVILWPDDDFSSAISAAREMRPEVIMVDSISVSPVTRRDVARLIEEGFSVWLISHEVKGGRDYQGDAWVGYEVDLEIRALKVRNNVVDLMIKKSRLGEEGRCSLPLLVSQSASRRKFED